MRYVYADTSIWNRLYDQNTEPEALSLALAERDAGFALGFNVLYEIAKQFFMGPMKAA